MSTPVGAPHLGHADGRPRGTAVLLSGPPRREPRSESGRGTTTAPSPGSELALIDELAEEALPRWNRSLRVALGRAAGAADENEANRRGRARIVRDSGVPHGRGAGRDPAACARGSGTTRYASCCGRRATSRPGLGVYNAAARHQAVFAKLLPARGSTGPASRNIAIPRIARPRARPSGSTQARSSTRCAASWAWSAGRRRSARWRGSSCCACRQTPRCKLDAAQAALLPLLPNGDPKLIVERLSSDVLRTAEELCANYGHDSARRVAALLVTEACRVRVDHGGPDRPGGAGPGGHLGDRLGRAG